MACSVDKKWLRLAIEEAQKAMEEGEIPVGAVIVQGDRLIARAHNRCVNDSDATAHAERLAIEAACRTLGTWRLSDCTLYVTLEPCPMCAGAAINARISRIVFAAKDPRAGALGSLLDLTEFPLEASPTCENGLLAEESLALLRVFFANMRQKSKKTE
ncbi:MAG: nucleoside deaminase [Ruminococcaceae bacterium]|nr:nucleoside deaminase [Oscillospiraceae bacterium]